MRGEKRPSGAHIGRKLRDFALIASWARPTCRDYKDGGGELGESAGELPIGSAGAVNGFWEGAEWVWCKDERYRPVESGTFPLAHGTPARVGRLRGYGNALNAEQAKAFIEAAIEALEPKFE
jgi:hypothetical protein